jgi:hypothetical protein
MFHSPYEIQYKKIKEVREKHYIEMDNMRIDLELKTDIRVNNIQASQFNSQGELEYTSYFIAFSSEENVSVTETFSYGSDISFIVTFKMDNEKFEPYLQKIMSLYGVIGYGKLPVENETTTTNCKEIVLAALEASGLFKFVNKNHFHHVDDEEIRYSCLNYHTPLFYIVVKRHNARHINKLGDDDFADIKMKMDKSSKITSIILEAVKKYRLNMLFM